MKLVQTEKGPNPPLEEGQRLDLTTCLKILLIRGADRGVYGFVDLYLRRD
jgi:hypothetical protein